MTKKHAHTHPKHEDPSPAKPTENAETDPAATRAPDEPAAPSAESTGAAGPEAAGPAVESPPVETEALSHRMLRLQADFENYRKRMAREKQDWIAFASEKLVLDLLPVLDHFELGLADAAKNEAAAAVTEGFRLIYNQLMAAIEKAGVQPIDAEGQPFDPNLHEAITHAPSDTVPEEHVLAQTRRGYRMGDKLLRAAQVVVSSGPAHA